MLAYVTSTPGALLVHVSFEKCCSQQHSKPQKTKQHNKENIHLYIDNRGANILASSAFDTMQREQVNVTVVVQLLPQALL